MPVLVMFSQFVLELSGALLDNGNFDGHGNLFVKPKCQNKIQRAADEASSESTRTNPTPVADETAQVLVAAATIMQGISRYDKLAAIRDHLQILRS
jgi:hypothetical protein